MRGRAHRPLAFFGKKYSLINRSIIVKKGRWGMKKPKSILEQICNAGKPRSLAVVERLKQATQRFGCVPEKPLTRAQRAKAIAAQTPNWSINASSQPRICTPRFCYILFLIEIFWEIRYLYLVHILICQDSSAGRARHWWVVTPAHSSGNARMNPESRLISFKKDKTVAPLKALERLTRVSIINGKRYSLVLAERWEAPGELRKTLNVL